MLKAIQLPAELALVKCSAHKSGPDNITLGNNYADQIALYSALYTCTYCQNIGAVYGIEPVTQNLLCVTNTWEEIRELQDQSEVEEKVRWIRAGCEQNEDGVWISTEGKTVLPDCLVPHMVRHIHGQAHRGRDVMVRNFKHYWFNSKF